MTLNWTTGIAAAAGAVGGALICSIAAKQLGRGKHAGAAGAVGLIAGAFLGGGLASPPAPAATTTSGTGTAGFPATSHPMALRFDEALAGNPQLQPARR